MNRPSDVTSIEPKPPIPTPHAGAATDDTAVKVGGRYVELRKLIPNLFTAAAFCCGIASIYHSLKFSPALGNTEMLAKAVGLLGASFLLDGMDGRLARMLRATSRFGEKFDSIADFAAFGLAPAFVLYKFALYRADEVGFGVVMLYSICAAIRLARFTIQAGRRKKDAPVSKFFQGLPAPASSFIVLIPVMLSLSPIATGWWPALRPTTAATDAGPDWVLWVVILHTVLVAALMVSTFPMASVKHIKINRQLLVPLMFGVGLIALCMLRDSWLTLSVLAALYLLSLPISYARAQAIKRAAAAAPTPAPPR